jgi:hypothetical protein
MHFFRKLRFCNFRRDTKSKRSFCRRAFRRIPPRSSEIRQPPPFEYSPHSFLRFVAQVVPTPPPAEVCP